MDCVDGEEEVSAETGQVVQLPKGLPSPTLPSKKEVEFHNLTHIPYRSWCPFCVAARRKNDAHKSSSGEKRTVPLFCADYCFVREDDDDDTLSLCVGRLHPGCATVAIPCESKGHDEYAVHRLRAFLKSEGISRLVYKSDQERALRKLLTDVVAEAQKNGDILSAVPESSAVGESASNGHAEAAVQQVEDQLRTCKAALESRLSKKIPTNHPVMMWLVEHVASLINRHFVTSEGVTAYQFTHGQRSKGRTAEFGEKVLYHVPKKMRHKLSLRWRLGIFLGTAPSSNEIYIGTTSGEVTRSRSMVRVVEETRWSADMVMNIKGTPMKPVPHQEPEHDDAWIEGTESPHEMIDVDVGEVAPPSPIDDSVKLKVGQRLRLTRNDFRKYGWTPECGKCKEMKANRPFTNNPHTEDCRYRIYDEFRKHNDPKWRKAMEELGITEPHPQPQKEHIDTEGREVGDLFHEPPPDDSHGVETPTGLPREIAPSSPAPSYAPTSPGQGNEAEEADGDRHDMDLENHLQRDGGDWNPDYGPYDLEDFDMGRMDEDDGDEMVSSLIMAGATADQAQAYAAVVRGQPSDKVPTFMEFYGRGSILREANRARRCLNIKGIHALDLRTFRPDGKHWDFRLPQHRRDAKRMVRELQPTWVIGSPPCTAWSIWNFGINYKKMDVKDVSAMLEEGRLHLKFMTGIYKEQLRHGRHFLHEHPASAFSWREDCIDELRKDPRVGEVVCDQCQFGLKTRGDKPGEKALAMKPTRFMSSSPFMLSQLDRRCDRSHKHRHLTGGRCAEAAFYPIELIRAILRGIKETAMHKQLKREQVCPLTEYINAVDEDAGGEVQASEVPSTHVKRYGQPGAKLRIDFENDQFRPQYVDEYTGEILEHRLIKEAMVEELSYFCEKEVWMIEDIRNMQAIADHVLVKSRWVLCNKGDAEHPDMRARLVACEVNKGQKNWDFYASTPPLESKKLLFSQFATEKVRKDAQGKLQPLRLSFIDIKKAYFNAKPQRAVFMRLPPEMGLPKHYVARQTRCVYGTRDAGMLWEETYRRALEDVGFITGDANPCIFRHEARNIQVVVHGNDFTALGTDESIDWYTAELQKVFEIKVRGRIGVGTEMQEIKILNRILRLDEDGLLYEPDPRHVDLLAASMGLKDCSPVKSPGVKPADAEKEAPKGEEGETHGEVIDPSGRIYRVEAATEQETKSLSRNDLEPATVVRKPLCSILSDTSYDIVHMDLDEILGQRQTIPMATLRSAMKKSGKRWTGDIRFNECVQVHEVTAYGDVYGIRPSKFLFAKDGMVMIPKHCDHYTGLSTERMKHRLKSHNVDAAKIRAHYDDIFHRFPTVANSRRRKIMALRSNEGNTLEDPHCNSEADLRRTSLNQCFSSDHMLWTHVGMITWSDDKRCACKCTIERPKTSPPVLCGHMAAARTPSTKQKYGARKGAKAVKKLERLSTSGNLTPSEATVFRALSARANYLAQDRPDIAFSTKELCREFAVPNAQSFQKLKRVVRYLVGLPRLVYRYRWQEQPQKFDVFTDSDFAGCKTSRRSTSGGVIMHGSHCIKHWATTQSTLSLSSGESELHGIAKGIQNGIGFQSMAKDMAIHRGVRVHSDATAAIGIARRRGLGKLRHLDVEDLWIQHKVRSKAVELVKVDGKINPADIFTKYVDHPIITQALKIMDLFSEGGRAKSAPAAAV